MKRTSMYKKYDDNDPIIPYGKCRWCKAKLNQRITYICTECKQGGLTAGGWLFVFWVIGVIMWSIKV